MKLLLYPKDVPLRIFDVFKYDHFSYFEHTKSVKFYRAFDTEA